MSIFVCTLLFLFISCSEQSPELNVGTTLFTKADTYKECWSSENLALLTSRMILEDLLPSTSIIVIDSNEFVTSLVEYFRLILEIVRRETHGKTKHITLVALTDLLGGYLYHAVLPIAKYAYYAGLIDYDSMSTLLGLYDELKWFLRTNGQGWMQPLSQNVENLDMQKLPLQNHIDKDQCQNLIFVEGDDVSGGKSERCDATIPMPFFDSVLRPNAIALPTKTCPIHSVEANSSSYLVMKFFLTSYRCLQLKNVKPENVEKYQKDFSCWINNQIIPRLADDKFYAAFGGILRVRAVLKKLGSSQKNVGKQIDEFKQLAEDAQKEGSNQNYANLQSPQMSKSSMVLCAVLVTIFVWFILGTLFICYKMRRPKTKDSCHEVEDSRGKSRKGQSGSTSLSSSKYFYPEKIKTPKKKKEKSQSETSYSRKPKWLRNKEAVQEITIKACSCHDDEEDEDISSSAIIDSIHTERRLPSITEMSEQTSSEKRKHPNAVEATPDGSTTVSTDERLAKVAKEIYTDSDSETEETSDPELIH